VMNISNRFCTGSAPAVMYCGTETGPPFGVAPDSCSSGVNLTSDDRRSTAFPLHPCIRLLGSGPQTINLDGSRCLQQGYPRCSRSGFETSVRRRSTTPVSATRSTSRLHATAPRVNSGTLVSEPPIRGCAHSRHRQPDSVHASTCSTVSRETSTGVRPRRGDRR